MTSTMKKLRVQIEQERNALNHFVEENLHSEKALEQSRFVDELIAKLYKQQETCAEIA